MFRAQMSPGGDGNIRSAISVMKQRLRKPLMPGQGGGGQAVGGPQGIDPSQVTNQGGQQSFTGRNGGRQMVGQAMARKLAAQQSPQAMTSAPMGGDTPEMQTFMQQNPGLTPDFIRNAAAQAGGGPLSDAMVAAQGGATGRAPDMPQFADKVGRGITLGRSDMATRPMPFGSGGGVGMGATGGFEPPEMSPDPNDPRTRDFIAQMGGQGGGLPGAGVPGPGGAQGMAPGLPPAVLQRLRAMRAGRGGASPYASLISGALGGAQG